VNALVERPARFWHLRADGRIECDLCPRRCALRDGQRGFCAVRARSGDRLVSRAYGRCTGLAIDPIEKKPLFHFLPGSTALSFGTIGCSLGCRFCQNWRTSKSRDLAELGVEAAPEAVAAAAVRHRCASVAYTYNEPTITAEYAIDTAAACRRQGVRNVAVTSGFVVGEGRAEFFAAMDAANVDLKAFDDGFYRRLCLSKPGGLADVLDTLRWLRDGRRERRVWVEITTLLIPGHNDGDGEVRALCDWVCGELGPDVPLHFTAFHPSYRMLGVPPTAAETCRRAREIGMGCGLRFVYSGNVRDPEGQTTWCPTCGAAVVSRDGYRVRRCLVTAAGACGKCGAAIAGVFGGR